MSEHEPEAGAPEPIEEGLSGLIDLTHLAEEDERARPPSLVSDPSRLWPSKSGLHSSMLSTSIPVGSAESWQQIVEELAEESRRTRDEAMRGALLCEAGRILIDRLGRQEDGELLLRRSESPLADLLRVPRATGPSSLAAELAELEARANNPDESAEVRAAAWVEFGLLCEERTPARDRALQAYRSALELVPQHPVALSLAAQAATLDGERPEAAEHLRELLQTTESREWRLALLLHLADLIDDPDEQLIVLEQARQARHGEEAVLRRLSRVLSAIGDDQQLGELYRELAGAAEDPISASTALHLAFLTLSESGQEVDALVSELASRPPQRADGTDMLAPLAELALYVERRIAAGDDPETVAGGEMVLERLHQVLDDPREQALVREQLARLRLTRLRSAVTEQTGGSPVYLQGEAADLSEILETDLRFCMVHLPEHRWVQHALAEVLELRGDLAALMAHLQEWARTQNAGPGRASILLRLGRVHEDKRRDLARAAEIYELAVAEDPDNPNCLRALGRVYERMRRWPQAVDSLRRQAKESDDVPERLAALRRVAQLAEQELQDIDLAIASLEEVAKLDPDDLLSLYQLVRLCRIGRRPTVLVTALSALVERVEDDVARTTLLVELGEVQELHFKQRTTARQCYEQALSLTPGYTPALRALARLYRDNGDLDELVKLLDPKMDTVTDPAVLALKAGRVCFEEIGDVDRAIEFFTAAYQANPDLVPARELLLQLLTASGRIGEAYDLLRAQDEPRSDSLAADYHYRLGLLAEAAARQNAGATPRKEPLPQENAALQHYRAALTWQPDHGLAFERSRRLLVAYHDTPNLVRLIESVLPIESGEAKAVHYVHLGRLHVATGEAPEAARRAYEEALASAPDDPIVRHEFEGLLRLLGDRKSLPALYLRTTQGTRDTHLRATLLVEAAELLLSTDAKEDLEEAAKAILHALQVDPGNPYAVRHLERLLSDPDSPFIDKEAVSARAVRAQSDAERAIFYLESAELLERVGAWGQARRAYLAAKGALPALAPADLGLKRTGSENRIAATTTSGKASIHVLLAEARDAAIASGRGDQQARTRALTILSELLQRDPQHRDAVALARTLAGQPGDADPVIDLLSHAFRRIEDPDLRYELGLFLGERISDLDQSIRFYQAASQARPTGRRALRGLVGAYRQLGDDKKAAAATERLLELFEPGEPSAIDLRMGIANFLGGNAETLPRAIEHGNIVLKARPDDPRAIGLMSDLLERAGRAREAAALLERLIGRERNRERLHDIYLRKAKLLSDIPEAAKESLQAVERAAALNPGNRDTITLLIEHLNRSGQSNRVATYLPPIRSALQANVARGAVSLRDLRLLAKVAEPQNVFLSHNAEALLHALEPGATTTPPPPIPMATAAGMRKLIADENCWMGLLDDGEPQAIHELLQALDLPVARMPREFPEAGATDSGPVPMDSQAERLREHSRKLADIAGLRMPRLASVTIHNAVLVVQDPICTVRIGHNLWSQGDNEAWRGLVAVAIARAVLGAPRTRALTPPNMDLLVTACFEVVDVFNPTTADPDPRRLRDVVQSLGSLLSRKQRKVVESACQSLAGHAFDAGRTARATTQTDLRVAALVSGDYAGVLAAACLLDGVVGGTLKQRVGRSKLARDLLSHLLSDEHLAARQRLAGRA